MEIIQLIVTGLNSGLVIWLAVKYMDKTDKNADEIYKFRFNYLDRFEKVNEKISDMTTEIKEEIATLKERTKE